ncbi:hypothetical protein [Actinocrispum wychmicini]|uniref:DUF2269 family protein n=1 Tax=Actinocrispum wychmicini TaxID=1213861 RepID=A0A4R2J723_9PSEU|nr:hypothetical protein [Actinocrispum wychmicini]TCO54304.1 hypothetical protein EV192_109285 [Actinocrispum wychmicini]
MDVAALITWLVTAVGGFVMLGTWIAKGGTRKPRTSHFPPGLIFGHFALAAAGLVVWIIYLITKNHSLTWIAFILLVPVALLGFTMLARWVSVRRAHATVGGPDTAAAQPPAERHFPVVIVGGHGLFAVVTVVLVLLTALR